MLALTCNLARLLTATSIVLLCSAACTPSEKPAESHDKAPPTVDAAVLSSTDEFQATSQDLGPRKEMPGAPLYMQHCAHCHDGSVTKAPHFSWLEMLTPTTLLTSLSDGLMRTQAAHLNDQERLDIAEYVTRARVAAQTTPLPRCTKTTNLHLDAPPLEIGWGHDTNRHTTLTQGAIDSDTVPTLELKWAFTYPGAMRARSQPAVGWDNIYTGSQDGTVYAFDLDSGCVQWTFNASAEVRTGIVLTSTETNTPIAMFGDILARLYAINAHTGELIWSLKADDHPSATLTGTPALYQNTLYVPVSSLEVIPAAEPDYACCTFRGSVLAVDITTGETKWRHYTIPEAPSVTGQTSVGTNMCTIRGSRMEQPDHRRGPSALVRRHRRKLLHPC